MSRHAARIVAVELLYGADVRDVSPSELLDERDDCDAFCRGLIDAVMRRRDELDRLISSHAHGWATERMSVVDRNVLRVGTAELLDGDVPAAAVIDEAVEIAKHFSGAESGRFVNGVLDAVRQEIAGGGGDGGEDAAGGSSSSDPSSSDGSSDVAPDGAGGAGGS